MLTECNIEIDGQIIERISQCKFVGLIVDDKLTWKCHIDYICSKVSKLIGTLIRARKLLPICPLITVYNSLLNPCFTYQARIQGASQGPQDPPPPHDKYFRGHKPFVTPSPPPPIVI